jgi:hypothetical protein
MTSDNKGGQMIYFLRAFFPIQLIFGHLKYNLLALFYWLVLFLIVSDQLGSAYGIPYLFYSPEYRGDISWLSFMLLGFSMGGFTMAFNTNSYMRMGSKYPFMATLSRPFIKFCWNNALIPLAFNAYFIYCLAGFQMEEEFASATSVLVYSVSYLLGFALFVFGSFLYFFPTNKDFFKISGKSALDETQDEPMGSFMYKKVRWSELFRYEKDRTYIYLAGVYKRKTSRSIKHYDPEVLRKVFSLNRINTSMFEIVTILAFIVLGMFRENSLFELPAGMSIVLLLTVILMLFSALRSWFHYWTYPVLILAFLGMNYLSSHSIFFQFKSYAYGLSYEPKDIVPYTFEAINQVSDDKAQSDSSRTHYLNILENWKRNTGYARPKLVVLITSGGGSRSALWTFSVLQQSDKRLDGELAKHIQLITGASGGMIGAAYFRSLLLKQKQGQLTDRFDLRFEQNISKDLLNKLSFSAYSNDLFFRYQSLQIGHHSYSKDRGYAFEQQLNENTEGQMNRSLSYYRGYEQKADIPTMIFSPTIVNDGRRLLVSSQSLAFLCSGAGAPKSLTSAYENIDFQSFFAGNITDSLRFTTVMRSSATFPFVLPMVTMPTYPEMHLMDAGLRDNYGGKVMMEFLFVMEDWIRENTSGVVILQIRDTKKILEGEVFRKVSLVDKFTIPFGNMYKNFPRTQDFDQDELIKIGVQGLDFPVDLVSFNLREAQKDRISLSWHLTSQEKIKIIRAFNSKGNQHAFKQLAFLLQEHSL